MNRKAILVLAMAAVLLAGCISVGDYVWLDVNGNGIQDEGEPGVEGVRVILRDSSNSNIVGAVTDSSGSYILNKDWVGTSAQFYLEFVAPEGYSFTLQGQGSNKDLDSDANPSSGYTESFSSADNGTGFDAGLVMEQAEAAELVEAELEAGFTSITGYVWVDANQDGIQDGDELPLEEVGVDLFVEGEDEAIQQTETDADGMYLFEDVEAGLNYSIGFVPPTEYAMTLMDQGDDDSLDSDADEETAETAIFALGEEGAVMDAGVHISGGAAVCYGPTAADFPENVSVLSGLEVSDPGNLGYRPLFLSISIFPASVRPPTGLSVSPQIYEIYIGEGETRLMTTFYGEFPEANFQPGEDGEGASGPEGDEVTQLIGNRVWFDDNANGIQDEGEGGVPNIPVTLYINGKTHSQTLTDGGGYYYFDYSDVEDEDALLQIFFDVFSVHPDFYFVTRDVGDDDEVDSDASSLGYSVLYTLSEGQLDAISHALDAGVRQSIQIEGLRSGRVAYQDVQSHYCGCLVTAGADPTVAAQINTCASAFGSNPNDIGGAGLDVLRLQAIAEQSSEVACGDADLAANLFCTNAPEGGQAATQLWMEYNVNNINQFIFNGAGAYNWHINGTTPATNQEFTQMTDGLNGEALAFENVVVMQVPHSQNNAAGTIFSLQMTSTSGKAYFLRDGQLFEGSWTTLATDSFDINSEHLPPVRFLDENGDPFAFAPGQIWINVVNGGDNLRPGAGAGEWEVDFDAPAFSP